MALDRTQPPTEEKVKCISCRVEEPANVPKTPMIQCDVCEALFHYSCVGVGDENKNLDWCCEVCSVEEEDNNASSKSVIEAYDVTINKLKLEMERKERTLARQMEQQEQTFARQMEAMVKAHEKKVAELRSMFAQFSNKSQGIGPGTSSKSVAAQVKPQSSEKLEIGQEEPSFDEQQESKVIEGQFTETENIVRLRDALKKPAFDLVQHSWKLEKALEMPPGLLPSERQDVGD